MTSPRRAFTAVSHGPEAVCGGSRRTGKLSQRDAVLIQGVKQHMPSSFRGRLLARATMRNFASETHIPDGG